MIVGIPIARAVVFKKFRRVEFMVDWIGKIPRQQGMAAWLRAAERENFIDSQTEDKNQKMDMPPPSE